MSHLYNPYSPESQNSPQGPYQPPSALEGPGNVGEPSHLVPGSTHASYGASSGTSMNPSHIHPSTHPGPMCYNPGQSTTELENAIDVHIKQVRKKVSHQSILKKPGPLGLGPTGYRSSSPVSQGPFSEYTDAIPSGASNWRSSYQTTSSEASYNVYSSPSAPNIPPSYYSQYSKPYPGSRYSSAGGVNDDSGNKPSSTAACSALSTSQSRDYEPPDRPSSMNTGYNQARYNSDSALDIIKRFNLNEEDLEELCAYSEDELSPTNLPYLLRGILQRNDERSLAASQSSMFHKTLVSQHAPETTAGPEANLKREEEAHPAFQQQSKVIEYGHTSKFSGGFRKEDEGRGHHSSSVSSFSKSGLDSYTSQRSTTYSHVYSPLSSMTASPSPRPIAHSIQTAIPSLKNEAVAKHPTTNPIPKEDSSADRTASHRAAPGARMISHRAAPGAGTTSHRPVPEVGSTSHRPAPGVGSTSHRPAPGTDPGAVPESNASLEWPMPAGKRTPTEGMIRDFMGVTPKLFPHTCCLCNKHVVHLKDWLDHRKHIIHLASCSLLRRQYSNWEPDTVLLDQAPEESQRPPATTTSSQSSKPEEEVSVSEEEEEVTVSTEEEVTVSTEEEVTVSTEEEVTVPTEDAVTVPTEDEVTVPTEEEVKVKVFLGKFTAPTSEAPSSQQRLSRSWSRDRRSLGHRPEETSVEQLAKKILETSGKRPGVQTGSTSLEAAVQSLAPVLLAQLAKLKDKKPSSSRDKKKPSSSSSRGEKKQSSSSSRDEQSVPTKSAKPQGLGLESLVPNHPPLLLSGLPSTISQAQKTTTSGTKTTTPGKKTTTPGKKTTTPGKKTTTPGTKTTTPGKKTTTSIDCMDFKPYMTSGATVMVTDLPEKTSCQYSEPELICVLEKFCNIECDKYFILPDNCTAFVEMATNKLEQLIDALANGVPLNEGRIHCHLLKENALESPITFYQQLLKWSEKVYDETSLEYRLVYISNLSTDEDYWMQAFKDGLDKIGGVRLYLPLMGKIFVEFLTVEDADRFGAWLSSFRPKPKIENKVQLIRPGIILDTEAVTPVCTKIQGPTAFLEGCEPPFWLVVPTQPSFYPTLIPQFYTPAHRTVYGPQDVDYAQMSSIGHTAVMVTGLPMCGYTHMDLLQEVWPYFEEKDISRVYYYVVILPLQRRAFIYFDDIVMCKEFILVHLNKPFTIGGCDLTLHLLLEHLNPCTKELQLYKRLLEWSNVVPEEKVNKDLLLITEVNDCSVKALKLIFDVMQNTPYISCIVLANRVLFQVPRKTNMYNVIANIIVENNKLVGDRTQAFPKPYYFQSRQQYVGTHMLERKIKKMFKLTNAAPPTMCGPSGAALPTLPLTSEATADCSTSAQDPAHNQALPHGSDPKKPPVLSQEMFRFFTMAIRQHRQTKVGSEE
ncbi:hypothetical protein NHX12_013901, partial [Muraenolepis orangiensis]